MAAAGRSRASRDQATFFAALIPPCRSAIVISTWRALRPS